MGLLKRSKFRDRGDLIANDPLKEFFVWWDDVSYEDADDLENYLNQARQEQDIQSFLESRPILLVQHLGGGQGRWVIPHAKLGAEYIPDFIIGERSSMGYAWYAVEIESAAARMFTKSGDPTKALSHAIRQVLDWRAWLQKNQNYASRNKDENGLGLRDIVPSIPGLILLGRRNSIDKSTNELRRQMSNDLSIAIHSYDFLIDIVRSRRGRKDQ